MPALAAETIPDIYPGSDSGSDSTILEEYVTPDGFHVYSLRSAPYVPVKEGWLDRTCGWFQTRAANHPKIWKATKFSGKASVWLLNLAAAAGNTFRWGR